MHGLEMRSRPVPLNRATRSELDQLADHVDFTWPTLGQPTITGWFDELFLTTEEGAPWLVGPAERDPMRGRLGTTILTRQVRARLKQFDGSHVPFRRVAIAYELNPDGPVLPVLPELRAGPHTCTQELGRVLVGPVPAHRWALGVIAMLDWASSLGGRSEPALHRSAGSSLRRTVFGVIAPSPPKNGQYCLWYQLTDGRW